MKRIVQTKVEKRTDLYKRHGMFGRIIGHSRTGDIIERVVLLLNATLEYGRKVGHIEFCRYLGYQVNNHGIGGRTPEQYCYDVANGWITEDLFKTYCNDRFPKIDSNFKISLVGGDRDRVFQFNSKNISGMIDLEIILFGKIFHLEIQSSKEPRERYEFKVEKLENAIKHTACIGTIISLTNEFFVIDPNKEAKRPSYKHPPFDYKEAVGINSAELDIINLETVPMEKLCNILRFV